MRVERMIIAVVVMVLAMFAVGGIAAAADGDGWPYQRGVDTSLI